MVHKPISEISSSSVSSSLIVSYYARCMCILEVCLVLSFQGSYHSIVCLLFVYLFVYLFRNIIILMSISHHLWEKSKTKMQRAWRASYELVIAGCNLMCSVDVLLQQSPQETVWILLHFLFSITSNIGTVLLLH